MRIGVIISSNDAETCWNAIRFANFCLSQEDSVKIFFMGKGVEFQKISTDKFNTLEQAEQFSEANGEIYACGSCIKSRNQESSDVCPISTMRDMYQIVMESDKVVSF